jgi:hypothetical protein
VKTAKALSAGRAMDKAVGDGSLGRVHDRQMSPAAVNRGERNIVPLFVIED